jgi:hypothetical protein
MTRLSSRKRALVALGAMLAALLPPVVVLALSAGMPRIGQVSAQLSLKMSNVGTATLCTGADGQPYYTYTNRSWRGRFLDGSPTDHKYPLSGTLTLTGTLTVHDNSGTNSDGLGIFDGKMKLKGSDGITSASGAIKLVFLFDRQGGDDADVRGEIDLPISQNGKTTSTRLIANVDLYFARSSGNLFGWMGHGFGTSAQDDSMEYNEQFCG